MCCFGEQPPPIGMLRNMLTGTSTMLRSQFRLTYNMILNLLRVEEMSVEEVTDVDTMLRPSIMSHPLNWVKTQVLGLNGGYIFSP